MTSPPEVSYADVVELLAGWLPGITGTRVVTDLPADLTGELPIVQIGQYGGVPTSPAHDRWSVDIDAYVPPDADGNEDLPAARRLAEQVRLAMVGRLPGYTAATQTGVGTVSAATCTSLPTRREYDPDHPIVRLHAAYAVTIATRTA